MDESRVLKRFPRGEACSVCRAKRWYVENGFRYCQNGHRVQSWVEFDASGEDYRHLGEVTRRQRDDGTDRDEPHKRKRLSGAAARTLFLECLQIILRKQVAWMVEEQNHPAELEAAVKDLWDLRLRGCPKEEEESEARRDIQFHSSQEDLSPPPEENRDWAGKEESWDPSMGPKWPTPSVVDTLLICYFACLLLRVPTTLGDIRNWANRGQMPYKKAHHDLPRVARYRLPMPLLLTLARLERTEMASDGLHFRALNMALAYRFNYDLEFPSLNAMPICIHYMRRLALPVEVMHLARAMMGGMNIGLSLPPQRTRLRLIDIPEICLVAAIVIAVKHFLAFPSPNGDPPCAQDVSRPQMDWYKWSELMQPLVANLRNESPAEAPPDIDGDRLANADDATFDAILALLTPGQGGRDEEREENVRALLSGTQETTHPFEAGGSLGDEDMAYVLKAARSESVAFAPRVATDKETAIDEEKKLRKRPAWRTTEDLPDIPKILYQLAAMYSGLSLDTMVRAADMFEVRLGSWQRQVERGDSDV